MPGSFDGFCSLWPGGKMRGMHPPTSHFENVFDVYNFSIISILFYSYKPYAFSTYIENVQTKCIVFGEALKIRVKRFKQNLCENYSKSTKITIIACKFSNFSGGGACPRTPYLEPFLCLNQLQISSAEKKIRLKKV